MADPQVVIEMIKNLAQSEFGLPLSLLLNPTNQTIKAQRLTPETIY
jgi:hypothetical protein